MKLKLIHKLLIAMFVSTALVLVLITLITRANIGRGFMDFLQHQERNRMELLIPELAGWYNDHQGWDELAADQSRFYTMVLSVMWQSPENQFELGSQRTPGTVREGRRGPRYPGSGQGRPRPGPPGEGGGPGPGGRNSLPQRIFLLDTDKTPVIGQLPRGFDQDDLLPIVVDENKIGWLGAAPISSFKLPEEEAFFTHLRNNLLIGLFIGLGVAALLAWLLARHLSRPINRVAEGIRAVAEGDFDTRLEIMGGDEIARLADDVNRLSSALGEHEATRKRIMSDMAHELRTPLAIISGELEAMSDGVRPLNTEQLNSVREEVRHLSVLVGDLHSLTLTDSGTMAYKMNSVDFTSLVQLAVDSFKHQAAKKNLTVSWTNVGQPVNLQGDEQRLRQLLHNLMDNAVRYTDEAGSVSVELSRSGDHARLTISDSAPGASKEECERMFERLYRLEASRNRNSGGSGLGLAICRNIVEAHGGQIEAAPSPDGGILITTTLPLDI